MPFFFLGEGGKRVAGPLYFFSTVCCVLATKVSFINLASRAHIVVGC